MIAIAALAMPAAAADTGVDLHAFWDARCRQCHGHAAEFARTRLRVEAGQLIGRHHTSGLRSFLGQHEMGPTQAEAVYAMLLAQAQTPPIYQQKCASCHNSAAELARRSLVVRDGVLYGRENGKPVLDFLNSHGRVSRDEAAVVVESLTRVLGEVTPSGK